LVIERSEVDQCPGTIVSPEKEKTFQVFIPDKDIDGTPFIIESARAGVDKLKEDLGYADALPLEKLLITQAALCWLRLNLLERTHWVKTYENHSTETGLYWDRRLLTAQRRFTRACESLARVRKLSRYAPALQVNIAAEGGQQVNVA
jgi:hypothetical protein